MPPLSILDLAFVPDGATPAEALRRTLELAQHAEQWGYKRFWLAEHHNMVGIASAATSVVIGYVAGGTRTIRVGAGGIMLPNHSPLVIAEQFGTLETLYPGRIDLGLGRAPGTGLEVPLWILGSSLYGAQLAAALGLPYAFASHFAPDDLLAALATYRAGFRPSMQLAAPYAMVGANVIVADTDAEARRIFTSIQQSVANLLRGARGHLNAPIDDIESYWTPAEKAQASRMLARSFVGAPATVRAGLEQFVADTQADEIIVAAGIFSQAARLRSYELLAELRGARLTPAS